MDRRSPLRQQEECPRDDLLDALKKMCYEMGLSTQRHDITSVLEADGKTGGGDLLVKDANI